MSIRVPSQTKQDTTVMDFRTREKLQEDRVVAALETLYVEKPVGSSAIGSVVGMQHRQTLDYLHAAKKNGRINSVAKKTGGQIAGWVPASVKVTSSVADQKAHAAAAAVTELFLGADPVSASRVARHLLVSAGTVARWLKQAERLQLVRSVPYRGWMPA